MSLFLDFAAKSKSSVLIQLPSELEYDLNKLQGRLVRIKSISKFFKVIAILVVLIFLIQATISFFTQPDEVIHALHIPSVSIVKDDYKVKMFGSMGDPDIERANKIILYSVIMILSVFFIGMSVQFYRRVKNQPIIKSMVGLFVVCVMCILVYSVFSVLVLKWRDQIEVSKSFAKSYLFVIDSHDIEISFLDSKNTPPDFMHYIKAQALLITEVDGGRFVDIENKEMFVAEVDGLMKELNLNEYSTLATQTMYALEMAAYGSVKSKVAHQYIQDIESQSSEEWRTTFVVGGVAIFMIFIAYLNGVVAKNVSNRLIRISAYLSNASVG